MENDILGTQGESRGDNMIDTKRLDKHYGHKTGNLPQWVQLELEDQLRLKNVHLRRYESLVTLLSACENLVAEIEYGRQDETLHIPNMAKFKVAVDRIYAAIKKARGDNQ